MQSPYNVKRRGTEAMDQARCLAADGSFTGKELDLGKAGGCRLHRDEDISRLTLLWSILKKARASARSGLHFEAISNDDHLPLP